MTRFLILLLCSLLVGAGGYVLTVRLAPEATTLECLPEDTLVLLEWDNVVHSWDQWHHQPTGEGMNVAALLRLVEQLGLEASLLDDAKQIMGVFAHISRYPSFRSLLATKAVMALLPVAESQHATPVSWPGQWVLALEANGDFSPDQFKDLLGPVQSEHIIFYQGESLTSYSLPEGRTLTCWQRRGIVHCAFDTDLIRRCIDQALKRLVQSRTGLDRNSALHRLREQGGNHVNLFGYADLVRLRPRVPLLGTIDAVSDGLNPQHLGLFHVTETDRSRWGIVALTDRDAVNTFVARHRLAAPVASPVAWPVSQETALSFWTNWFDLPTLWQISLQRVEPEIAALMLATAQQVSALADKPLDAFFDVFGNGFGVFINTQSIPHQSDRSTGCLIIEVRDRPAVAAMIKHMLAGVQVIAVQSGETEIFSVMLAGGLLQPAYALVDNYLILADSIRLVEQGLARIASNVNGDRPGVTDKVGNVFLFTRTSELVDRLEPVLNLLAKETGERARLLTSDRRRLLRDIVLPVLASLRGMATNQVRGSIADDTIQLEVDYTLRRH